MEDLVNALKGSIEGEVRFDRVSRLLYSTDASIYQIEPLGVVIPKHRADVKKVVRIASDYGVPILPRGGGTALAGQSIGKALILDFSKHVNRVLELNTDECWVRVEPGVVLDELNAYLRPHGLQFAPDVATSNRANIGGMISNNSSGAHSIVYGKTIDHVSELQVILADGSEVTFCELNEDGLHRKMDQKDLEGQCYREVVRLAAVHREEIGRRYPKVLRRVGGYNLDEFTKGEPFNMCRMVVGSEGTLATIVGAKLHLVPLPKAKVVGVAQFHDLREAMKAVVPILETGPAALELMDKMIMDQTKGSLSLARQRGWIEGDPGAALAVEYFGETQDELVPKLAELEESLKRKGLGYTFTRAVAQEDQDNVWNVRKAGLGLLMGVKGDKKPIAFIEDAAVPTEALHDYIAELHEVITSIGTTAGYYAHASVGLLHVRPMINLKREQDIRRMRTIAERTMELALKYGGAMSGEHGDGLVRSCWNEQIFGSKLYEAFREVKRAFDPRGLMNPGKIVDAQMMTQNLRYGPHYSAQEFDTHFDFSADGGFHRAVEMCNGVGECRKKLSGTMCPSYMATLEEEHSTRGRANALRAAISGKWEGGLTDKRLYEVLGLCLECKACKAECPSNVDMAKIKYEFLSHYYKAHGRPLRSWLFGNIELVNKIGCSFAPLANRLSSSSVSRLVLKELGIAPKRSLPPFAREPFTDWFARHKGLKSERKVVLFHDTYMTYNHPEIGVAATRLFETAGHEVLLPSKVCCGRPMLSSGMVEEVKTHVDFNVASLYDLTRMGYPIVGIEPSCVSMLRDDYLDLTRDPRARAVSENTYTAEEYLNLLNEGGKLQLPFSETRKEILVHGHCHQKALWGIESTLAALAIPQGYTASAIDSGCCGMAGAFGYEAEKYEVSLKVGEDRLLKAVREAGPEVEIAAPGFSCRQQIAHATERFARHPVEILWEDVKAGGSMAS